jgi:hypothetical protein
MTACASSNAGITTASPAINTTAKATKTIANADVLALFLCMRPEEVASFYPFFANT